MNQEIKDRITQILLEDKLKRDKPVDADEVYNIIAHVAGVYGWSTGGRTDHNNVIVSLWNGEKQ